MVIYNPLETIKIGYDKEVTYLDLSIMDKNIFEDLKKGKYSVTLDAEIIKFFNNYHKFRKSTPFEIKQKMIRDDWKKFNLIRSNRMIRQTNQLMTEENREKLLVEDTLRKKIIWNEILCVNKLDRIKHVYRYKHKKLIYCFEVTGYKKEKWHFHFELQWENLYGDKSNFGGQYFWKLYNAIKANVEHDNEGESIEFNTKHGKKGESKRKIKINKGDFLVKTNLFKCYYSNHLVEEIIGLVNIVYPNGEIVLHRVAAAYCSECDCFYLLESQYEKLRKLGILLCRLVDKEEYYKTRKLIDINLAHESLMMKNGYNVKANNGLSDVQRQTILQNFMDNNILTPHKICSYLDMFIAQKKDLPQYKKAIEKWEIDKKFVLEYRDNEKKLVEIEEIKR